VQYRDLPAGHYQVGFAVSDLEGRQSERLTDIEVRAEGEQQGEAEEPAE